MHALRCSDGSSTTTTATTTTGGAGAIAAAGGSSGIVSGTSILQLQQQQQQQQQVQQQQCPSQQQQQQLPKGGPVRINGVKGYQNRTNHIIYCPPLLRSKEDCTAVVYFGGDVQWNLENTALLLRDSFPRAHIVVVRPMRMEYSTFSCFDNFVRGNNAGIPDHTPMHFSLQHLEELLNNLTKKLTKPVLEPDLLHKLIAATSSSLCPGELERTAATVAAAAAAATSGTTASTTTTTASSAATDMDVDVLQSDGTTTSNNSTNNASTSSPSSSSTADINELLWWRESLNLDKANLALMGFSKGCVVLNQFIYEFHYYKTLTPDDSTMMRLVSRIKDMYWLDGGHGGGKNTWITSRSLLETLCRLGINVHVHVTPYQIQDDHRPWIRKEEKAFTDLLKRLGAPFDRHLYPSEANSTNLFTHFEVLNRFRQYQINVFAQQQLAGRKAQAQQQQQQQPILTQLEQMGVVGAGGNSIVTAVDAVEQMITGGGKRDGS
ncbi:conserved hypothetical protein [Culex quinquefasciatus]|uniref:Uncharacterized protein n=1 Tax=Culex quinquefasciatus TaxID=7176 RepID=B0WUZ9_CULQU|nr:conserved hypothetical protein [Culex quinquefasciatus]|eukprot:XP_001860326.1 conserved hypothetical protein [Culex quinquefasciatus]